MFAIVDILGQQFKVLENKKYYVPRLTADENTEVTFETVLLKTDDNGTQVGAPYVAACKVTAKVLEHVKDDKVIVFKKKRRISYRKLRGHRQHLTRIEIVKIGA